MPENKKLSIVREIQKQSPLTVREIQNRQQGLCCHREIPVPIYNKPWLRLGEIAPALWKKETLQKWTPGQMETLIGAAVLQIADYCNAKGLDLEMIVRAILRGCEELQKQEQAKNAETEKTN